MTRPTHCVIIAILEAGADSVPEQRSQSDTILRGIGCAIVQGFLQSITQE
jgi:hypothetical protein